MENKPFPSEEREGSTCAREETGTARHAEPTRAETIPAATADKPWLAPDYPTLETYDRADYQIDGTVLIKPLVREPVVKIPYGVTEIGDSAFAKSIKLTEVIIPDTVRKIGNSAFTNCDKLTKAVIPAGVEKIGENAFYFCTSLMETAIPETVTVIGGWAFNWCSFKEITIHESVKKIGFHAFSPCHSVKTTIYCEAKKESIEWNAEWQEKCTVVWNCRKVWEQTPALSPNYPTLEHYDEWYFKIENKVLKEYFGYDAEAKIPRGVTKIDAEAFRGRETLKTIVIPDSVTEIGAHAFAECEALEKVTIPESVKTIGEAAFCGCRSLNEVILPESVTEIGTLAFSGCESLRAVALPASTTNIGENAFSHCNALEKITVDSANKAYRGMGNCLLEIKSHALIAGCKKSVIPMGVLSIAANAFHGCELLESITIPASVKSVGESAFSGCESLESITIPAHMKEVGKEAFKNCPRLTIYCEGKAKPSGWDETWNPDSRPVVWSCNKR